MILGIAGRNASGKGEVVAFLEARSFHACSLSDVIREELRARGEEESRERMIELGRALRAEEGPDALVRRLLPRLKSDRNIVVDSIRHPAEALALRQASPRFRLIWVEADEAIRLARIRKRGRPGDPTTLERLRELEGRELAGDAPGAQQLQAVR